MDILLTPTPSVFGLYIFYMGRVGRVIVHKIKYGEMKSIWWIHLDALYLKGIKHGTWSQEPPCLWNFFFFFFSSQKLTWLDDLNYHTPNLSTVSNNQTTKCICFYGTNDLFVEPTYKFLIIHFFLLFIYRLNMLINLEILSPWFVVQYSKFKDYIMI